MSERCQSNNCRASARRAMNHMNTSPSRQGRSGDFPMNEGCNQGCQNERSIRNEINERIERAERNERSYMNGCGMGCRENSNRGCQELLRRLQILDFSIAETVLYLDVYPCSKEAMAHYRALVAERDALKKSLAEQCGMPITAMDNASAHSWDWIKNPWPWELEANE